jgi:assimilatory nitrate reductase catalytic subunit
MSGEGVNALTSPAFDPHSKQPELKHAAAEVSRVDLPYRLVGMRRFSRDREADARVMLAALKPLMSEFDYATVGMSGRDDSLVTLRGYAARRVPEQVLDRVDALFALNDAEKTMRYVDARRGIEKAARIEAGVIDSVCLSGETAAQDWLKNMMLQAASADAARPWVLAPVATPPRGTLDRGRIVCTCVDVSENEIGGELRKGADVARLQATLKCGTECGSCLPELRRLSAGAKAMAAR